MLDIPLATSLKIEKNIVFILTSFVITFVFDMHLNENIKKLSQAFAILLIEFGLFITFLHVAYGYTTRKKDRHKLGAAFICYLGQIVNSGVSCIS